MKYTIYTDGLCEPNNGSPNGKATWGFSVYDGDKLVYANNGAMVGEQTNNTAEYAAMIGGLTYASADKENEYEILTDSLLVVNQLNGRWLVKSDRLQSWYDNAKDLIEPHVTIGWVQGSDNKADGLTRLAYAEATGLYPHPRTKGEHRVKFTPIDELPDLFKDYLQN